LCEVEHDALAADFIDFVLDGGKLGVHCAGTEYVFTNSNITKSPAIKQKGGKKLISFRPVLGRNTVDNIK